MLEKVHLLRTQGKQICAPQKGLQSSRVAGLILLRFTLINYSKQFKLTAAALRLRVLIISLTAKSIAYSKFFSLNGHSSTTTQPRHNGLRALQILRPCQINQ